MTLQPYGTFFTTGNLTCKPRTKYSQQGWRIHVITDINKRCICPVQNCGIFLAPSPQWLLVRRLNRLVLDWTALTPVLFLMCHIESASLLAYTSLIAKGALQC